MFLMAGTVVCRCSIKSALKLIQKKVAAEPLFDRVVGLQHASFFEKKTRQNFFSVKFCKNF